MYLGIVEREGLPGCFFFLHSNGHFLHFWDHTSCHEGLGHIFIDDPPRTNGILLFTGDGNIGPV